MSGLYEVVYQDSESACRISDPLQEGLMRFVKSIEG